MPLIIKILFPLSLKFFVKTNADFMINKKITKKDLTNYTM